MSDCDAVVIGTGTAGQTAAYELKANGLTVAVVEKSAPPGGTCALAGCQAKKWFYEATALAAKAHHLDGKGVLSAPQITWNGLLQEKKFSEHLGWPTYRRIGMTSAAYKILTGEDGMFLGAHILSGNAAGIINTVRLAMLNQIPVETLYRQSMVSPYPSRENDMRYMLKPLTR